MFNPSNKQKIEALEDCIDSFKYYLEQKIEALEDCIDSFKYHLDTFNDEFKEFKREIGNDFFELKCKHEEAVEAGGLAVEQIQQDISLLQSRVDMLNEWYNQTCSKFAAIMNYLDASFTEGLRVVDNEECSEEV